MEAVEGNLDLFTEVTQGHKWTQKWKGEMAEELTDFVETCFTQVCGSLPINLEQTTFVTFHIL